MAETIYELQNTFDDIVRQISGKRGNDGNHNGHCPCHNDKQASLSVKLLEDRIVMNCFGCGADFTDLTRALGYKAKDLYLEDKEYEVKKTYGNGSRKSAYRKLGGEVAYVSERIEKGTSKTFKQYAVVNGVETKDMEGAKTRYPYRLNDWYKKTKYIFLVEGEKCVDALFDISFPATTSVGGASFTNQWEQHDFKQYFEGVKVIAFVDNDPSGWQYVDKVTKYLRENGVETKTIDIVTEYEIEYEDRIGIKGDVADIIDRLGKEGSIDFIKKVITRPAEIRNDIEVTTDNDIEDLLHLLDWDMMDKANPFIRNVCERLSEVLQVQPHLILGAWLTQISAVFQRYIIDIAPVKECNSAYVENFGLYSLYIASSGRNKSGLISFFGDMISEKMFEMNENLKDEIKEDTTTLRTLTMRKEKAQGMINKLKGDTEINEISKEISDLEEEIDKLKENRAKRENYYINEDSTVEALRDNLYNDKLKTCIIWADEIKKLIGIILGEYKKGGTVADDTLFLKAYNAKDYTALRKGQRKSIGDPVEYIEIKSPQMTVFGGIQTALFDNMRNSGSMQYSGFWARFLFWIDSKKDPMKLTPNGYDLEKYNEIKDFVKNISDNGLEYADNNFRRWKEAHEPNERIKKRIWISQDAFTWLCKLFDEVLYEDRSEGGRYFDDSGWFGKMQGHMLRYAATIHCINSAIKGVDPTEEEISEVEMMAAWECGIRYMAEVAKVVMQGNYTEEENASEKDKARQKNLAREIREYMHKRPTVYGNLNTPFVPSEIPYLNKIKNKSDIEGAINMLKAGKILLPTGGLDSDTWIYNRKGVDKLLSKRRKTVGEKNG